MSRFALLPFLFVSSTSALLAAGPPCSPRSGGAPSQELRGTVNDTSGAAVPGVLLKVDCPGVRVLTHTEADGNFRLRLPTGIYPLTLSRAGFETVTESVEVAGRNTANDFTLSLAHAATEVSVVASEGYVADTSAAATKSEAPLLDTPVSTSVITLEQLSQRGVQTLNEALRYTPGVAVESFGVDPRYDAFNIRGFDSAVNGTFLDNLRFPGYLGQTDPYYAESVTVLKGPASVLYGQNGPGGLVNITSKQPPAHRHVRELQFDLGTFNRKQVRGDFGGQFDRDAHWRYRLTGLFRNSGTQVNYSPDNRWFVAPALTWAPTGKTSLTLLSYYQRDKSGWAQFLPASGTLIANPNGIIPVSFFSGIPGFDGVRRQQWSLGYLVDHRFNDTWSFHQGFRSYNVDYNGATAYGLGLAPDNRTLNRAAYTFDSKQTLYALDNRLQAKTRTGPLTHSVLAGFDASRVGQYPQGTFTNVPGIDVFQPVYNFQPGALTPYLNNRQWTRQLGTYVQDQVRIAERWTVLLNGRYDWTRALTRDVISSSIQDQTNRRFTGRAGLSYTAPFGFAPYVSYSTSFLPVIGVNFFGQPYQPTTGRQFETGLKWQPAGWSTFVTAAYYNIDQRNVQTTDPNNPLNSIQTGRVRSRGAEFEVVSSLARGLTLHAGYSFDEARVTETAVPAQLGRYLLSVPRHTASSFLGYEARGRFAGIGGGAGVRYTGVAAGSPDNTLMLPGYTLFDASVHYDWHRIRFAVDGTNLGDRRYVGVCNSLDYCNYGFARRIIGRVAFRW